MGPVYIGSVFHCVKIQMDPAFGWKKIWRDAFVHKNNPFKNKIPVLNRTRMKKHITSLNHLFERTNIRTPDNGGDDRLTLLLFHAEAQK